MNFELTAEQQILKDAARDFLKKECPVSLKQELYGLQNRFPYRLWKEMSQLDWMGVIIPEVYGGIGGSFMDLAVILEEMGRCCCPGPFFSSAVMATLLILEMGTEEQKKRILPDLATGKISLSAALRESEAANDPACTTSTAKRTETGFILNGTKMFAEDAALVDSIIVAAKTDSRRIGLFLVDRETEGAVITPLDTLGFDNLYRISISQLACSEDQQLGGRDFLPGELEGVLGRITVAACAKQAGNFQAALEKTVDYTRHRKQFNQPIGSFQAMQHHCADMLMDADCARYLTWHAAWKIEQGTVESRDISMAKVWTDKASRSITLQGHLAHGAIAFCEEHPMHLHYRTAKSGESDFGSEITHLEKIAVALFGN